VILLLIGIEVNNFCSYKLSEVKLDLKEKAEFTIPLFSFVASV